MVDSNTVLTTPFGRSANVNNASQGVFLTYRRAQPNRLVRLNSVSLFVHFYFTSFHIIALSQGYEVLECFVCSFSYSLLYILFSFQRPESAGRHAHLCDFGE